MNDISITSYQRDYEMVCQITEEFWSNLHQEAAGKPFAKVLPLNKEKGLGVVFGYRVQHQERPCIIDGCLKAMKVTFYLEHFEASDNDRSKPKLCELCYVYILKGGLVQEEHDSDNYITEFNSRKSAQVIASHIMKAALENPLLKP